MRKIGLRRLGPIRRHLALGIAITAAFTAGMGTGLVLNHHTAIQAGSTTAAASPATDARRQGPSRDRVVQELREFRSRTGNTLSAACRDPRTVVPDDRFGVSLRNAPAAELAFYDVESFNTALHNYRGSADEFPVMSYRQIGLYTKGGARLSYFTDGRGNVQRDPVLDPPFAVYGLDWCRSLNDFNAA